MQQRTLYDGFPSFLSVARISWAFIASPSAVDFREEYAEKDGEDK